MKMALSDDILEKFILLYYGSYSKELRDSILRETAKLGSIFAILEGEQYDVAVSRLVNLTMDNLGENLRNKKSIKKLIKKYTSISYSYFKLRDNSLFPKGYKKPKFKLGLLDKRAIKVSESIDQFYLGKFIDSPKTKASITKWMRETYLEDGLPIGKSPKIIAQFQNEFGKRIGLEDYQARRVIDTSMSRIRGWGHVTAMEEAEATEATYVGIRDSRQSDICKNLTSKGKFVIKVTKLVDLRDKQMEAGDDIANVSPLLNRGLNGDDLKNMDGDDLQEQGYGTPPFHEHCRTRLRILS